MKKIILLLILSLSFLRVLEAQTGLTNTGVSSGTAGNYNSFFGYFSGNAAVQAGSPPFFLVDNAFFGAYSGQLTTSGIQNAGIGSRALYSNTSGSYNTALGYKALYSNTTAGSNVGIGNGALSSNLTGYYSTAIGASALASNSVSGSTAIGFSALGGNTTGGNNTATGYEALLVNSTASNNTANGYLALSANTTGFSNTSIGALTMILNTTGKGHVAVGEGALHDNSTGSNNTALGEAALAMNSTGTSNTAVGNSAGVTGNISFANLTGSQNTFLGANAGPGVGAQLTNSTSIGFNAAVNANNTVVVGNSSVTSIGGFVGWSNLSDGRFKTNVKEDVSGLAFITQLRPVSYTFNKAAYNSFHGVSDLTDQQQGIPVRQTGFIAQEVEVVTKTTGFAFGGLHTPQSDKDNYSLCYGDFVVPLVKAIQELSIQLKGQQNQLDSLKKISVLTVSNNASLGGPSTSGNLLYQNIPNPSGGKTVIPYQLQDNNQGQIFIFDMVGTLKKKVNLSNSERSIEIQSGELAAGLYIYSLVVGGVEVSSKRMIIN